MRKYKKFMNLPTMTRIRIVRHIEHSCKEYTMKVARKISEISTWDNPKFTHIYHNRCYNLLLSLEKDTYKGSGELVSEIIDKYSRNIKVLSKCDNTQLSPSKHQECIQIRKSGLSSLRSANIN